MNKKKQFAYCLKRFDFCIVSSQSEASLLFSDSNWRNTLTTLNNSGGFNLVSCQIFNKGLGSIRVTPQIKLNYESELSHVGIDIGFITNKSEDLQLNDKEILNDDIVAKSRFNTSKKFSGDRYNIHPAEFNKSSVNFSSVEASGRNFIRFSFFVKAENFEKAPNESQIEVSFVGYDEYKFSGKFHKKKL